MSMSDHDEQDTDEVVPPKVGDIEIVNGMEMQVMSVSASKGPLGYAITYSAEPIARARGYRISNEALGFVAEQMPPPDAARGTRRSAEALTNADWDFRSLLKKPLCIRSLALFHELMRESARMRGVCAIYQAGLEVEKEWEAKIQAAHSRERKTSQEAERLKMHWQTLKAELDASRSGSPDLMNRAAEALQASEEARTQAAEARLNARKARREAEFVSVSSGNGHDRHEWREAAKFLFWRLDRLPDGAGCVETSWIASDRGWRAVDRKEMAAFLKGARKFQREQRAQKLPAGLRVKDVRRERPRWPFDRPVQVANEWRTNENEQLRGRPCFHYNSGMPGLPEVVWKGNGKDAERILSESVDLCVCFNFRDEEIVEAFETWLKNRRASLHDDLADFRVSDERPQTKMKSKDVNAALLGIAALRLRARFGPKEAAYMFQELYGPDEAPSIGNTQKRAKLAVRWQQEFLRYCPLDSEERCTRELGVWDRECPLCFRVWELPHKSNWSYDTIRCPWCDHREDMRWTPKGWKSNEP